VAASIAARRHLAPVLVEQWRMPLADTTRQALATLNWEAADLTPAKVAARVQPAWH
jgi:hypothetical protein